MFESIILLSVLASAVVLVLPIEYKDLMKYNNSIDVTEAPDNQQDSLVWEVIHIGFLVLFLIELIAKVIALGCWGTTKVHGRGGGGGGACVFVCVREGKLVWHNQRFGIATNGHLDT